jgi:S-adenosyl methyltransferase
VESARSCRAFLSRVVTYLTAEAGIRQFLDLGSGLPSAQNVHEVAQSIAPQSRVVYVDHDPIVLLHARALLRSRPEGATGYIQADIRNTGTILANAEETLDFSQPVAVMLLAVLHFVTTTRTRCGTCSPGSTWSSPGSSRSPGGARSPAPGRDRRRCGAASQGSRDPRSRAYGRACGACCCYLGKTARGK